MTEVEQKDLEIELLTKDIQDWHSHYNGRIHTLITTIESQKEEIKKGEQQFDILLKNKDELYAAFVERYHKIVKLEKSVYKHKAITELAVKGLQNSSDDISSLISEYPNEMWTHSEQQRWVDIGNDGINAINTTLSEIERLSHE